MRHRKKGKHLSRTPAHRKALRRNLASSLFLHGRVRTTKEKAREVRPFAEKLITIARKGGLANFRRALALLNDKRIVQRLFREIGPRYADRPGGYTRILKLDLDRNRLGDNGSQVFLELLEAPEGATGTAKKRKAPAGSPGEPKAE